MWSGALSHTIMQRIWRRFKKAKHNILTFVIVQKWTATKPLALCRTQHRFWFPKQLVGKCKPCIGMMGSSESIGRGSFAAIKASIKSMNCVVVIKYLSLSFWKVVQLKPDQPDRANFVWNDFGLSFCNETFSAQVRMHKLGKLGWTKSRTIHSCIILL